MFKALFSNLFKIKLDRTIGVCREVTKKKMYFLYFTEKDKERLEDFLGDRYDYDFTENGVIIWDEESMDKIGLVRSLYFPYNSYIIEDEDHFYCISKQEFDTKYEVIRW